MDQRQSRGGSLHPAGPAGSVFVSNGRWGEWSAQETFPLSRYGIVPDTGVDLFDAIQELIDTDPAPNILFDREGEYLIKKDLRPRSNQTIAGIGATKSILRNDQSATALEHRACILVGNHHPALVAAQTSYALDAISAFDVDVTCTTAADADNLSVGELVIVGSETLIDGASRHAQLNKVRAISSGVVTLVDAIEEDIADPVVWTITGTDAGTGDPIYAVENVVVENLGLMGRAAIGTKGAMFHATFRDLWCDVGIAFASNLMTHTRIKRVRGFYTNRLFDWAQNSYDVLAYDVDMKFVPPAGAHAGITMAVPVLLEQQSYRMVLEKVSVRVDASYTTNSEIVAIKGSKVVLRDCDIRHDGSSGSYAIHVPNCSYTGFRFDDVVLDNCRMSAPGKARIAQVGGTLSADENPRGVRFVGGELRESVTSESILFQAGTGHACSSADRTGDRVEAASTGAYPDLTGYRRLLP
jgi:hypothetical protein